MRPYDTSEKQLEQRLICFRFDSLSHCQCNVYFAVFAKLNSILTKPIYAKKSAIPWRGVYIYACVCLSWPCSTGVKTFKKWRKLYKSTLFCNAFWCYESEFFGREFSCSTVNLNTADNTPFKYFLLQLLAVGQMENAQVAAIPEIGCASSIKMLQKTASILRSKNIQKVFRACEVC